MSSSSADVRPIGPVIPAPIPPNQTLYINNLNTRTRKPELRQLLYALFSPYGQIIDLVALKTEATRGQAFVVFKETASAIAAMRALQGYPFLDKSLRIQFARTRSQAARDMDTILAGGALQYVKPSGANVHDREEFDDNEEEEEE